MLGPGDHALFTTPRLTIRPLTVADADEMATVLADAALHEFTGGHPASLAELRARFAAWEKGSGSTDEVWCNWIVRSTSDGVAVGTMQATVTNPDTAPVAFVAWTIGTPWQGRGYAGEAATGLVQWLLAQGIEMVAAHVHPDHAVSCGVARRAGLRPTDEIADGEVVWRLDRAVL